MLVSVESVNIVNEFFYHRLVIAPVQYACLWQAVVTTEAADKPFLTYAIGYDPFGGMPKPDFGAHPYLMYFYRGAVLHPGVFSPRFAEIGDRSDIPKIINSNEIVVGLCEKPQPYIKAVVLRDGVIESPFPTHKQSVILTSIPCVHAIQNTVYSNEVTYWAAKVSAALSEINNATER